MIDQWQFYMNPFIHSKNSRLFLWTTTVSRSQVLLKRGLEGQRVRSKRSEGKRVNGKGQIKKSKEKQFKKTEIVFSFIKKTTTISSNLVQISLQLESGNRT